MKNLFKLIIIILPVIFTSCGKSNTYNNKDISREEVMDTVLPVIGYGKVYTALKLSDNNYLEVSEKWLSDYKTYFKSKCREDGLHYSNENPDCDDFVRAFAYYAQIYNKKNIPVAIGEFSYPDHVVNIVITTDDTIFIEPQSGDTVELTEKQIENCNMVRF